MELFIPSLLVLVIICLFAFLIIPRMSIPLILIFSIIILVYVLRNHYHLFYNEYRYSTWQYNLQQYAPFVIVFVLAIFIFTTVGITTYRGNSVPTTMPEIPPLPSASSATNSVTSVINNGMKAASDAVTAVTDTVSNITKTNVVKNVRNQGSSSTYNLTSLLTSNKNKTN